MRVARIITRLNVGGPSIQAATLTDRLTARGVETALVHGALGEGEGDMRYLLDARANTRQLSSLRRPVAPWHDARVLAQLVGLFRTFRPHIVHTHMAKAGTLGRTAAALYNRTVARPSRARVVHTYHGHVLDGYFSAAQSRFFVAVERQLARHTDALVAISPEIRRELADEYRIGRPAQYHVIPLGFELGALASIDDTARRAARDTLDIPAGVPVITTVGRLTAIKEHRLFLDAAAAIASVFPYAVFLMAGDGELRDDLEAHARMLRITRNVRFLGWRRDLATIYGATDVFLLTSRNEGTPVALIESLAAGVPGVSTNVGGVRDVIGDEGLVGLLAPFGDARALADAVLRLIENPAERAAMGARGRASVLARFTLDRLVDEIEALYLGLLA